MLALDTTLHWIEAEEPDVIAVYQSDAPVTIAVAGLTPAPCEAYVCAVRKQDSFQVYAALMTNRKKVLVYKPSSQPKTESDIPPVLREAVAFTEGMGFRMESINLNYSPAMRAVVVKNIGVLRAAKKEPAHKPAGPEADAAHKKKVMEPEKASSAQAAKVVDIASVKKEPPAPKAKEAVSVDNVAAVMAELAVLREEKDRVEKKAGKDILALQAELSRTQSENASMKEQLANLQSSAASSSAQLLGDIAKLREQLAASRAETAKAARDNGATISSLTQQAENHKEKLVTASSELASAIKREQAMSTSLESLRAEVLALTTEKESLTTERDRAAAESSLLRAEGEKLQARVAELISAADKNEDGQKGFQAELEELRKERHSLGLEVSCLKTEVARLTLARDAAEARTSVIAAERDALAENLASAQKHIDQPFAAVGQPEETIETQAQEIPVPPVLEQSLAPTDSRIGFFEDAGQTFDHFSPFGFGSDDSAPVTFDLQKEVPHILYRDQEDVLSLMRSVNTARITPDGDVPGSAMAYICSVRRDQHIEISIGLQLTESRRIYIYQPEHQPQDAASTDKIVQDAVLFAEMVGFFMEPCSVPEDPEKRASAVSAIPVLVQEA